MSACSAGDGRPLEHSARGNLFLKGTHTMNENTAQLWRDLVAAILAEQDDQS
jgi:hypothetical protein